MKTTHHPRFPALVSRLVTALSLGLVLLASASCSAPDFGGKASDNAEAIEQLESRFDKLESGLGGVVFWQALAAVFFVLSGFALVGGAALGSRARRDQARSPGEPGETANHRPLDDPAV